MGERDVMSAAESFLEGIQRTGADVAEDDADRADSETQHSAAVATSRRDCLPARSDAAEAPPREVD